MEFMEILYFSLKSVYIFLNSIQGLFTRNKE